MSTLPESPSLLPPRMLEDYVSGFLGRAGEFRRAAEQCGTPVYAIDFQAVEECYHRFNLAFSRRCSRFQTHFAVKSNNHPLLMEHLVRLGSGLDVSSGLELKAALMTDCDKILFSGPGKTESELELAVRNADRVTLLLDSPAELDRLNQTADMLNRTIRAGVRLRVSGLGGWSKFGIDPKTLQEFFNLAGTRPRIKLCGLQFHTSWNLNPQTQVEVITALGGWLRRLGHNWLAKLEFVDIGGGFWPEKGEWLQPAGLAEAAAPAETAPPAIPLRYHLPAASIDVFAARITEAFEEHIFPYSPCAIYAEPGRWLCDGAMHILVRVEDHKAEDLVITDGGINLIGWERFETDFAPLINLSRPSLQENPCLVCGPLCTPRDFWGHSYFGLGIRKGDLLLIPDQGAYTYSLRQEFIKPIAPTAKLPRC